MEQCSKCHEGVAVLRVHLDTGADVYWCGDCIVKFAREHGHELSAIGHPGS